MKARYFENPQEAIAVVQGYIDNMDLVDKWTLEAGCGSMSRIKLPDGCRLSGVDISSKQLERNAQLSERVCGDIQSIRLEEGKYALAICWNVLEHLPNPEKAIVNIGAGVSSGGRFIISVPNRDSFKGIVTRLTPHAFHVMYHKHILGRKDAGKNDTAPFVTFLCPSIGPNEMSALLEKCGFEVEDVTFRDGMVYMLKKSHYLLWLVYAGASLLLQAASLGRLGGMRNSDFTIVAKKVS